VNAVGNVFGPNVQGLIRGRSTAVRPVRQSIPKLNDAHAFRQRIVIRMYQSRKTNLRTGTTWKATLIGCSWPILLKNSKSQ
jgi:hypothetical protein